MGKRSDFERRERDYYPTPPEAVAPLLPHLTVVKRFCEPCAGDGRLVRTLEDHGYRCAAAWDIDPRADWIDRQDASTRLIGNIDCFITNPPWPMPGQRGEPVISILYNLVKQHPVWFLLSADFAHNKYFSKVENICQKIVSVGRVSWEGNGVSGKDNCAWYYFDLSAHPEPPRFYGRK